MITRTRSLGVVFACLLGAGCWEAGAHARGARTAPHPGKRMPVAAAPAAPAPAWCGSRPVEMNVKPLSPYVYQQGDGYAYFDVWIQACPVPGARRQPIDLVLVLDTSGSMGGMKIANARAAASYLLSALGPHDRLSLVTYNTRVTSHFALTPVTRRNRSWMSSRIEGVGASGMTNLGGGLAEGIRHVSGTTEREAISRVILLSDGLANVGVTSPAALNAMVSQARRRGVGVSTVGVGVQFNEILLQGLAEYGGGRYHYVQNAQALLPIVRQEIAGVQATVATSVQIIVSGCPGCQVVEAPGYALHREGGRTSLVFSDLAGGERRKALVKVKLPTRQARKRVLDVRLSYQTARGKRRPMKRARRVAFTITRDRRKVAATVDKRVAGRLMHVQTSKDVNRAMKAYQFGDAAVAGSLLSSAATRLERHHKATGSKRSLQRARRLRDAARRVSRRGSPSSAPARHLQKQMRQKAAESNRH